MSSKQDNSLQQPLSANVSLFIERMRLMLGGIFSPSRDIYVCRAPSILGVLGEMTAPVGGLVLQYPLQHEIIVAMQKRVDRRIIFRSVIHASAQMLTDEINLDDFCNENQPIKHYTLQKKFSDPSKPWILSIIGLISVLLNENILTSPTHGFNIAIESTLPLKNGVVSLSALNCAFFMLLKKIYNFQVDDLLLFNYCDLVAQKFFGIPSMKTSCVAAALAQSNELMSCLGEPTPINYKNLKSHEIQFIGVYCGDENLLNRQKYLDCEISLLMCIDLFNMYKVKSDSIHIEDPNNILPDIWNSHWLSNLPHSLLGEEFLDIIHHRIPYKAYIQKDKQYHPRRMCEYSIREHHRGQRFLELLDSYFSSPDKSKLIEAGSLLYESQKDFADTWKIHFQTLDVLFDIIRNLGPENGFYGARYSFGGEEGIVTIFTSSGIDDHLKNIAAQFKTKTDLSLRLLTGSSSGAFKSPIITTHFE